MRDAAGAGGWEHRIAIADIVVVSYQASWIWQENFCPALSMNLEHDYNGDINERHGEPIWYSTVAYWGCSWREVVEGMIQPYPAYATILLLVSSLES